jgi:hypothetical protein
MSDTLHRKPTLQELALGFGQVAKEQGLDVYVVLCGEANPSGSFERISMIVRQLRAREGAGASAGKVF